VPDTDEGYRMMAFFKKLKETQKQRRKKQIVSGLFLIAAIVGIWLISRFADNKSLLYGLDILAIVYFDCSESSFYFLGL